MRTILIIFGCVFAAVLVVAGIGAAVFIPRALRLDHEAADYLHAVVPKIVGTWNAQELLSRATPQLITAAKSEEEIARYFTIFGRLGALKHLEEPQGMITSNAFAGQGVVTIGNYVEKGEFEKGPAVIQIQLQRVHDTWKINGFHVNSEVLMSSPSP